MSNSNDKKRTILVIAKALGVSKNYDENTNYMHRFMYDVATFFTSTKPV